MNKYQHKETKEIITSQLKNGKEVFVFQSLAGGQYYGFPESIIRNSPQWEKVEEKELVLITEEGIKKFKGDDDVWIVHETGHVISWTKICKAGLEKKPAKYFAHEDNAKTYSEVIKERIKPIFSKNDINEAIEYVENMGHYSESIIVSNALFTLKEKLKFH